MKPIRNPHSTPRDWYIDTACIDCGASRHVAPDLIIERQGKSVFAWQPATPEERLAAWRAVLVCLDPLRRSVRRAVCDGSPRRRVRAYHRARPCRCARARAHARQRRVPARRPRALRRRLARLEHERAGLVAFRDACWYSWSALTASLARLTDYRFEWLLPGHGWPAHLAADKMNTRLRALVARMRKS